MTNQPEGPSVAVQIATMCRDTSEAALDGNMLGAIIVGFGKDGRISVNSRGFHSLAECYGVLQMAGHSMANAIQNGTYAAPQLEKK